METKVWWIIEKHLSEEVWWFKIIRRRKEGRKKRKELGQCQRKTNLQESLDLIRIQTRWFTRRFPVFEKGPTLLNWLKKQHILILRAVLSCFFFLLNYTDLSIYNFPAPSKSEDRRSRKSKRAHTQTIHFQTAPEPAYARLLESKPASACSGCRGAQRHLQ